MEITVATRYHGAYPGGKYSGTACVDFLADAGFTGLDVSLEEIGCLEDAWESVLYAMASRARARGLSLPTCHLPFAMPNPDHGQAMATFAQALRLGVRGAKLMGIPVCVMHPIVRHARALTPAGEAAWIAENEQFLGPIVSYARARGIKPLIENMANTRESETDHLFGSTAAQLRRLSEKLGCGICWDFGHAHLTGLDNPCQLAELHGCVGMVHIHDNDGKRDAHAIPYTGQIDWERAMCALRDTGYSGPLNLELKGSDLPADSELRQEHAREAIRAARRLCAAFEK